MHLSPAFSVPVILAIAATAAPASFSLTGVAMAAPYTKVCNSGQQAGTGACPAAPVLGTSANDWACTIDRQTNMMWEVKSPTSTTLRSFGKAYTNYDDPSQPQKSNGLKPSAAEVAAATNVMGYIAAVNATALCGKTDWRRPTFRQLNSLVVGTAAPTIDGPHFPNTINGHPVALPYTTTSPAAGTIKDKLYMVSFYTGQTIIHPRDHPSHVRLVTTAPKVVVFLPDCGINPTAVGAACYIYMIFQPGVYVGRPQNSYGPSTLPASYPAVVRCERPAPLLNLTAPGNVKCMRKYRAVKLNPINGNIPVTDPSQGVEVFPPE